jgi:multicomponent Na+:H+ antiporter subunit A
VTEATGGRKRLSELGGLARRLPVVAAGSAVAAATVAALPLTVGFFADELFFKAALERGAGFAVIAVSAAALTFAYLGRFWVGVFLGSRSSETGPLPQALVLPIACLGGLAVLGGLIPAPVAQLAGEAGEVSVIAPAAVSVAYHLDLRAENVMALAAWGGGAVILLGSARLQRILTSFARVGARVGPERLYDSIVAALNRVSDAVHDLEVRDLRTRVSAVLVPASALVVAGILATPTAGAYVVGNVNVRDIGLLLALLLVIACALGVTAARQHLTLALALATVGYGLAAVYAFFGAPDVALVAVLVETVFALLLLGVFSLLPPAVLRREARLSTRRSRRWRDPLVAVISGCVAFLLAWGALSRPTPDEGVAARQTELAPAAHANDVVTAILADFRALDTLVEVTVVAVAFAGVASLLRRGRLR